MSLGLVGRKVGMTRIFAEDGASIPVTVLDVSNNRVTQVKTPENDGYAAVQVSFGKRRASRVSKPLAGHLAKAGVEAGHTLKEFRVEIAELANFKAGDQVAVTIFAEGQKVDISGKSIGKGFQGGIKRHNFSRQDKTHGASDRTRAPGASSANTTPGRLRKGKRMPGHMGQDRVTSVNIKVAYVDAERNLLGVAGSVPGGSGTVVVIKPSVKAKGAK